MLRVLTIACLVALTAVLLAVLLFRDGGAAMVALSDSEVMPFVYGVLLLIVVGTSALGGYRGKPLHALRDLAAWTGIAFGLVVLYSFRQDLTMIAHRVADELLPPGMSLGVNEQRPEQGERSIRIRRRNDGHFVARSDVNGTPINMLVDTGATTVVLRPADAQAAGIDLKRLSYSVAVQTANGTAYAAPVRLRSIAVGSIVLQRVDALVAQPGTLNESLLGMSFLRRLRSYEFSGDFLTLRG